jgi:8-hydroxy-5-deazaflavin:NADPH oxidoreductase
MNIGILGVGAIGKTLGQKLSAAGHDVKVANSRGPETIDADVLSTGARAVPVTEAVKDVDVVILSIPLARIPDVAPLIATVPSETVVIDTSNYVPFRDSELDAVEAIEAGQVESLWVSEQLGRPVVKAWNSVLSTSFAEKGTPAGTADRVALPVAADDDKDRAVGMALVEDTGFDGFDAGMLAESWRQQPASPVYCTDLKREEIPAALASAEAARMVKRRDLTLAILAELTDDFTKPMDVDSHVLLNRMLFR